jgi:CheY-like chemotaxis protein
MELMESYDDADMTLSALLVCVDHAAAEVLQQVLKELGIEYESCPDFSRAAIRLAQDRFDLMIMDGESNSSVMDLLRETRLSRVNDSTLAVAVVSGQESIREMFSLGVNFAVYKPVAYERALSSLRAARAVMRKEKRKSARAAVHAQATVDYANAQQERATLVDLAQDGMQVLFGKRLPPTSKVYFQFQLPGQSQTVRLSGQVVWQDWNGRAGVTFADLPKTSRRLITDFLNANLPSQEARSHLPDVTVEMQELQIAHVAVQEQTHGSVMVREKYVTDQVETEPYHEPFHDVALEKQSDVDNRRAQTRYSCRIGAEVYCTGRSVPNHCCLTDLSAGGCYLEVSLPFPQHTSVEIVVRTHDLKLRLRGAVQASHPGYGMGVAFELKTREEQDNVKKLTEYVIASA